MSTISGPGGIGGPKGPGGPEGPDGPDGPDALDGPDATEATQGATGIERSQLDASIASLAADIKAGRMTPREAIDRMVDDAGADLGETERAELRELLTDLVENDPYLAALVGRIS
ncbi:MAG: hypothetical protein H0T79_00110 [Deltaproteobacteria bacterium]|nr:hypothetical protein [Deltaproteobacteria bacterium]